VPCTTQHGVCGAAFSVVAVTWVCHWLR